MSTTPPASSPHEAIAFFATRYGIDARVLQEMLSCALECGGDYADLFFEHRRSGSLLFEEQAVKRASGGIVQGVGVRVVSGEATGYAHTEDLSREGIRQAAQTAARIARHGRSVTPQDVTPLALASRYGVAQPSSDVGAAEKLALLRRADAAARAHDPSIERVVVSLADEMRYVLVATSDGRMAGDAQPMLRFNVQCLSERDKSRQSAVGGGGGASDWSTSTQHTPETLALEAARRAVLLHDAVEAPAGTVPGRARRRRLGHPPARGDWPRPGGGLQPQEDEQLLRPPRAERRIVAVHGGRRRHDRRQPRVDQHRRRGQPAGPQRADRQRHAPGLHAGPHQRAALWASAPRAMAAGSASSTPDAAHDQHLHAAPASRRRRTSSAPCRRACTASSYGGGQVNISNGDFVFTVYRGRT